MIEGLRGRRVVIALSGGISAYKICGLVSTLVQAGVEVRVVMTEMATRFVGPLSFEALTGQTVIVDVDGHGAESMEHIHAAKWGECFLLAPCTANMLAKLSLGLADEVVSTISLAFVGPQVLAPAMNPEMWKKASVRRNVEQLREDGFKVVEPAEGYMACGDTGVGRLPSEETLIEALVEALA